MELEPMLLNELIRSRRSVKTGQFMQGSKIPDDVIRQAIHNATWAPNHGKTEPWFFKIFTGDGLRLLSEYQSDLYKHNSGDKFNDGKYQKLINQPAMCSHIISIGMKRDPGLKIREMEEIEAVACAVQNIYLTLTAYGYGGYWSTGGVTYMPEAKPFFGLGENDKLLGFFFAGVVGVSPAAGVRKPVEVISEWVY